MRKAILFPFEIKDDNSQNYAYAMELAKVWQVPLILFTSLPNKSTEADIDEVYHHLLQLNGFYQSHFNNWQNPAIEVKKIIKRGSFKHQLQLFVEQSPWGLVMLQRCQGES